MFVENLYLTHHCCICRRAGCRSTHAYMQDFVLNNDQRHRRQSQGSSLDNELHWERKLSTWPSTNHCGLAAPLPLTNFPRTRLQTFCRRAYVYVFLLAVCYLSRLPAVSGDRENCTVNVLVPKNLELYGLSDEITLNDTLTTAVGVAEEVLNTNCTINLMTIRVCDLRETVLTALEIIQQPPMENVLFGPPCPASAQLVSLLGAPIVTWVPVTSALETDEPSLYDSEAEGPNLTVTEVSSFGSYDSLAQAVLLVLKEFNWENIASLYSRDEFCATFFAEARHLVYGDTKIHEMFSFHVGNSTDMRAELFKAVNFLENMTSKVILTCMNPEMFASLLETAVNMSVEATVFLQMNFATWTMNASTWNELLQNKLDGYVLYITLFNETHLVNTSITNPSTTSFNEKGQFLDYFYDSILMWAAARNRTNGSEPLEFRNLSLQEDQKSRRSSGGSSLCASHYRGIITDGRQSVPLLQIASGLKTRTGDIHLDSHGVRQRRHSLLHFQGRQLRRVADLDGSYIPVEELVWPKGFSPTDTDPNSSSEPAEDISGAVIAGVLGSLLGVICILLVAIFCRRWRLDRQSQGRTWLVNDREVKRRSAFMTSQNVSNGGPQQRRLMRMDTRATLGLGSVCSLDRNMLFAPVGSYRGTAITVKPIHSKNFRLTRDVIADLNMLKELHHDNLNTFVGAHMEPGNSYVLFKYCAKGSLQDVLENEDITLDWMFKMSFALDIARGMEYLHKSPLKSHGNLKSSNCVIDSRWVLKITDFGAVTFPLEEPEEELSHQAYAIALLWTAPELLRMTSRPKKGTQRGDVFSFAIVLQEILLRVGPYGCDSFSPEEIIEHVKRSGSPPFRPHISKDIDLPERALTLMTACWDETPEVRPDFHSIRRRLHELNGAKKINMVDNMLSLMETYSSRLEQLVSDRTEELAQEKAKTDRLLYQMLPQSVAEQLKCGRPVVPESFDAVSIFFSDIVGFTTIASQSRPLEVVDLLNDLYTAFDDVIFRRDVYKVETIGDAYMCVSGCPHRNGRRHSSEIADMALDLISTVMTVKIRHRPQESLQLRIGLHTGPCAAGVVGVAMPRYCLFGDTVNMASRMESSGKALHIHISSEMHAALEELDLGFLTLERGMIQVKGKGLHKTYWLVGKTGYSKPLPDTFTRKVDVSGHRVGMHVPVETNVYKLRQLHETANSRAPSPSNASLTVDGMYGALRKTSISVTVTSESDDGSTVAPGSPTRSDSGGDSGFVFHRQSHQFDDSSVIGLPPFQSNEISIDDADDSRSKRENGKNGSQRSDIPRIEIS